MNEPSISPIPKGWRLWWIAARPRTLSLAATPVLVGCALAWSDGAAHRWLPALATLGSALLIQVGTNLHNDAADFESGNDRADRVGPIRVSAAGWAQPSTVRRAALIAYALALALGGYLVLLAGWPILLIGIFSLFAGWAYSAGPYPVSHSPLGELFVWLFFGLLAVAGSAYLQGAIPGLSTVLTGSALGLLAAAVLMVNNTRDRIGDIAAGRRTLAALLGIRGSQKAYAIMILAPFILASLLVVSRPSHPGALLTLLLLPSSLGLIRALQRGEGAALNVVLADTARTCFLFGLLLALGMSL